MLTTYFNIVFLFVVSKALLAGIAGRIPLDDILKRIKTRGRHLRETIHQGKPGLQQRYELRIFAVTLPGTIFSVALLAHAAAMVGHLGLWQL